MRFILSGLLLFTLSLCGQAYARPLPPEVYGQLPGISDVGLSPSGDRIAMIVKADTNRSLIVVTPDGKLICSTEVGQLKVQSVIWAGEDHLLVIASSSFERVVFGYSNGAYRLSTAISIDVRSGKFLQLFKRREHADSIYGFYGTAQSDGHWYGWFDVAGHSDIVRVDVETGDYVPAAAGYGNTWAWAISASGQVVARTDYDDERQGHWRVLATQDKDRVLMEGHARFGAVGDLELGRTPDTVLFSAPNEGSSEDHGSWSFHELSLTDGSEKTPPDHEVFDDPLIDPFSHLWIGYLRRNDEQEPVFFSPTVEARWHGARKAFPNNFVRPVSWNADFSKLIVHTDGGDDSGTYWYVDISKHSARQVGNEYDAVTPADVGRVRMVDWHAADGLALRGVLTLPPGRPEKSLPLVVLPHGGPESRDYPGFDWWAQAYASQGYAVFQPNFRGSGGYGVAFRDAGFGQWGRKMQTDVSDGVADLARQGIVDPKRACIVGASYGGYVALAGVTVQQGLYRCAVSVAGVADLTADLREHVNDYGKRAISTRYWKAFMGANSSTDSSLDQISPTALARRADAPVLLIHGKDDSTVPYSQSERMEAALKEAGKPVEFVTLSYEDHYLQHEAARIQMLTASVAFVEKYNPPD